ncbi:MAG: hypothetical protein Q9227_006548 [Pyrenula ochraceoflavens]
MANENIETSFQDALDAGQIAGAIICVSDAKGHFVYNRTLGERTLLSGEKKPHQLDDVVFLASATKLLTTIAALQCVEDGLLSLTGDLSSVAPELAAKQVITGFSEDGETPLLEPLARPITLEMLLSHSSGFVYHFLNPLVARWREKFGQDLDKSGRLPVEELYSYPLAFQPGAGWMYGTGVDWAGRIVERATGKTLGERMHERIFGPLGITDAQFYPVTREDLRARQVDLNPSDPDGLGRAVIGGDGEPNMRTKGDFGGHGLFMTAADYVKILQSLMANDGKILKPAMVDDMFEPHHLSPEATKGHRAALASPTGVYFLVGTAPELKSTFGFGGHLTLEDVEGWYGERTLSWGGGLTLAWFIDRKHDLCGICAIQASLPSHNAAITTLKQIFRTDVYRKHAAWKNGHRSS